MTYLTAIHSNLPYHKIFFYEEHNPLPSFLDWEQACILCYVTQLLEQEMGKIKNPLDDFYKSKSSIILADLGSIVEQNKNTTEINTPEGVHIQ